MYISAECCHFLSFFPPLFPLPLADFKMDAEKAACMISISEKFVDLKALAQGRTKECLIVTYINLEELGKLKTFTVFTQEHLEVFKKGDSGSQAELMQSFFDTGPATAMWVVGSYVGFNKIN